SVDNGRIREPADPQIAHAAIEYAGGNCLDHDGFALQDDPASAATNPSSDHNVYQAADGAAQPACALASVESGDVTSVNLHDLIAELNASTYRRCALDDVGDDQAGPIEAEADTAIRLFREANLFIPTPLSWIKEVGVSLVHGIRH